MDLPVIAYVIAGVVVLALFGFAFYRNASGKNIKKK